jgi:hypothetical protein
MGTDVTGRERRVGVPPGRFLGSLSSQAPESVQGSTSSDGELSSETEYSVSDQGGHDNRCPKKRIAETDVGTSKWTLEEWRMLLTSGDASDSNE